MMNEEHQAATNGEAQARHQARRGFDASTLFQLACLLLILAPLLFFADRGYDFTDETYYLAWIAHPADYAMLVHGFGYGLHPIYDLFGRSIVAMRVFGVVLLTASGAALGWFFRRYYRAFPGGLDEARGSLILLGAIASLSYYDLWVVTPSYNLLVNAGVALVLAGLAGWSTPPLETRQGAVTRDRPLDRLASLAVGFGGCLAVFGKPPAAAILALAAVAALILSYRRGRLRATAERALIAAAVCLVPLFAAIEYSGSLTFLIESGRAGVRLLDNGDGVLSIVFGLLADFYFAPALAIATAALLVVSLVQGRRAEPGTLPLYASAIVLNLIWLAAICTRAAWLGEPAPSFVGIALFSVALAVAALGFARGAATSMRSLAPLAALALAPFVIVLGTANNSVTQLLACLFPIIFGGCIVGRGLGRRASLAVENGLAAFTVLLVWWGALRPYGYPASVFRQTELVDLGVSNDRLKVDPLTLGYIRNLRHIAAADALRPGTPIVDLSGGGPGTGLFLGARAPLFPWVAHVTQSAPILADAVWNSMSAGEAGVAWIVGPVHPSFAKARLVAMLAREPGAYRCVAKTAPMMFWGKTRQLTLWARGPGPSDPRCAGEVLVPPEAREQTSPPPAG